MILRDSQLATCNPLIIACPPVTAVLITRSDGSAPYRERGPLSRGPLRVWQRLGSVSAGIRGPSRDGFWEEDGRLDASRALSRRGCSPERSGDSARPRRRRDELGLGCTSTACLGRGRRNTPTSRDGALAVVCWVRWRLRRRFQWLDSGFEDLAPVRLAQWGGRCREWRTGCEGSRCAGISAGLATPRGRFGTLGNWTKFPISGPSTTPWVCQFMRDLDTAPRSRYVRWEAEVGLNTSDQAVMDQPRLLCSGTSECSGVRLS